MKALVLAAGAAGLAATLPASAAVVTVGNSLARSCYEAAEVRSATPQKLSDCDRALVEESLTFDDRFATHVNRGILRMVKRDFVGAEDDYNRAIAMKPNHPDPWLNLGIMRFNQGNSAAALPLFEKALQLGTKAPEIAYFGRGLANEDRGDLKAAYADLVRARALKPGWTAPALELQRYQVVRR